MKLDLYELEKLAKAATPGPWRWRHFGRMTEPPVLVADHGSRHVIITDAMTRCRTNGDLIPMYQDQPNSDYIASANPTTILALIQRVRNLERVAEAAKALKNGNSICTCERSGICERCTLHEALAALEDE